MSFASLLTQSATVARWADRAPNSYHEVAPGDFTTLASGVPCLLQHDRGKISGGKAGADLAYSAICFFLPDQDIRPQAGQAGEGDKVTIGSGEYKVVFAGDESGQGEVLTAWLTEF